MSIPLQIRNLVFLPALLVATVATAAAQIPVPVSGYEVYLGQNCTVAGAPATCGATFTGWTGETNNSGWLAFPGTGKGVWTIQINYTGHPQMLTSMNPIACDFMERGTSGAVVRSGRKQRNY